MLRAISGHINGRAIPILTILFAFFFLSCGKGPSTSETPILSHPPETAYPMPPAKATNSNLGWTVANIQHVRLADSRGKVVVLDFYATWCEPCRDSVPRLVDLQKRYGARGLQIVGLNVGGEDDYEKIPAFAREFQIQYQLGIPDPELEDLYTSEDQRIPQTLVIDRNGALVKRFVGYGGSVAEDLEQVIQSEIAKSSKS
jgi:thiol-disulfide isomerase/thioredoxin